MSDIAQSILKQKNQYYKNLQDKEEKARAREERQTESVYVGKKKHPSEQYQTSKTVFNFIPLPFMVNGTPQTVRSIDGCFKVLVDTGRERDDGMGTVKNMYLVSSLQDFTNYETSFNTEVLTNEQREYVLSVQRKLWNLKPYLPYFDNAIKANDKKLPQSFLDEKGGKVRIDYAKSYMVMPAILLSTEIYSKTHGESLSKVNKFVLLHFAKNRLVEDWFNKISEWSEQADFNEASGELFGVHEKGKITKYLSLTIDDDPVLKKESPNSPTIPNRITDFSIQDYDPKLFASKESGTLEITPELLAKAVNYYDVPNFYRVATYEEEIFKGVEAALNQAEVWIREATLAEETMRTQFQQQIHAVAPQPVEAKPVETKPIKKAEPTSLIPEDDVPF